MSPLTRYQAELSSGKLQADPCQAQAMRLLQSLYEKVLEEQLPAPRFSFFTTWFKRPTLRPIQGLYFWGGVGRGKTCLMDLFYQSLPEGIGARFHFHRFMLRIHTELNLEQNKGKKDPLLAIAQTLGKEAKVLCFDEFYVSDITDAMLLGTLLQALFEQGVILVTTSNIPPDELYKNGLQRARFLPAIKLLNQHCHTYQLDHGLDYRLRTLKQAKLYLYPCDTQAHNNLLHYFQKLSSGQEPKQQHLEVSSRTIKILGEAEGVLFIHFSQLCQTARSQNDYIELARLFHTVLISEVNDMSHEDDSMRRFIAMVDEFYERNVSLIISAHMEMEDLYRGKQLKFEFKRCLSRLKEMQSVEYLAKKHIP